jgi:lipopolysaccharide export system permease protein
MYLSPTSLRELRRWVSQVRAEVVTNNVQPGRFMVIDGHLTLHIRSRAPNGKLLGIMVDDRRNPKERVTVLAEKGDVVNSERGVFLVLENGTAQRHVAGQLDPDFVLFREHAFDLTRNSSASSLIRYSVHERFPSELWNPPADDPLFREQPGQFRAEIHNRILAPFYPIAFLVITFVFLGAPRTTRQSRIMSFVSALAAVSVLRGFGFFGAVVGAHRPIALVVPYLAMAASLGLGFMAIARGVIIEPPAFVTNAVNALVERVNRRAVLATGQTP